MSTLIFENPKRLTRTDIYLQIIFGLGILFLVGLFSPLRNHGQPFSWTSVSFLVFGGVLLMVWIVKALRETTLKTVRVEIEIRKVTFVLYRQMRDDLAFDFHLNEVHLDIQDVPDRSLPRKKVLFIRDNQTELKISSRQKGLSEKVLFDIVEKLKHYPQQ